MSAASRGAENTRLRRELENMRAAHEALLVENNRLVDQLAETMEVNRSLSMAMDRLREMWNRAHLGDEKPL